MHYQGTVLLHTAFSGQYIDPGYPSLKLVYSVQHCSLHLFDFHAENFHIHATIRRYGEAQSTTIWSSAPSIQARIQDLSIKRVGIRTLQA
jgi:hypothetical protein